MPPACGAPAGSDRDSRGSFGLSSPLVAPSDAVSFDAVSFDAVSFDVGSYDVSSFDAACAAKVSRLEASSACSGYTLATRRQRSGFTRQTFPDAPRERRVTLRDAERCEAGQSAIGYSRVVLGL